MKKTWRFFAPSPTFRIFELCSKILSLGNKKKKALFSFVFLSLICIFAARKHKRATDMEDLVLSIPTQDTAFVETLAQRMGWTMHRRTRSAGQAVTPETDVRRTEPSRREAAMLFVQNLSVRGGQPVPADERGIDALINEKYDK